MRTAYKLVEPGDETVQHVDPHQVWWTALGPTTNAITLPVWYGRFECHYCDKVYSQKCTLHSHKVQCHRQAYDQERHSIGLPQLPPLQESETWQQQNGTLL